MPPVNGTGRHASLCALSAAALLGACTLMGRPEAASGTTVHCPDGSTRLTVRCASVAQLKGKVLEVNAGLPKIGLGFGGHLESQALAQVQSATHDLAMALDQKCEQYNACAIDAESWLQTEHTLRQHVALASHPPSTPDPVYGNALWSNAAPDLAAAQLRVRYQVQVREPGGDWQLHANGGPAFSGSALRFALEVNRPAHLYVLLLSSQGVPSVLFPIAAAGLDNPLPADSPVHIPRPGAGVYLLDDVTGREHLHIIASLMPLTDLEKRLQTLGGHPTAAEGRVFLESLGELVCVDASPATLEASSVRCGASRDRGIVFQPDSPGDEANGSPSPSLQLAVPNDTIIVHQHEIDHRPARVVTRQAEDSADDTGGSPPSTH